DKYITIYYKLDGKPKQEALGWISKTWEEVLPDGSKVKAGWTEKKAAALLSELQHNQRTGVGPKTLAEKRELEARARKEAEMEKAKAEIEQSIFKDAGDAFLKWAKTSKKDWDHDSTRLRLHVNPILGDIPLKDVRPSHIEKLKVRCQEKGLSPGTVRHCLQTTRAVFNHAARLGSYRGENPTRKVRFPKLDNARKRFFTHNQADQLLSALWDHDQDLHDITLLGFYVGLRFSEIACLRWENVNLEYNVIYIINAKSGESREAYITENLREMFLRRQETGQTALVFPGPVKGGVMKDVSDKFMRIVNKLGFNDNISDLRQKLTFHSTRHSFGSWLALQGTPLLTIKELMGHKTIEMTMRYAHLMPDHKREAVDKLSARKPGKVISFNQAAQA
ncbi:MAG: tyrosine-type recombinase/integrase, partial [Desulfonatronovibrio sp.]